MSFPPILSDVETHHIDALHAARDTTLSENLKQAPLTDLCSADEKAVNVLRPCQNQELIASGLKEDHSTDLVIATQINNRAPDFMTAKSYTRGYILPLDKPKVSLGLTERQLNNLDLATQFSDFGA